MFLLNLLGIVLFVVNLEWYCSCVTLEIVAPNSAGHSDNHVVLIVAPDANINGSQYKPLGLVVQSVSSSQVWLVLLNNFTSNVVNPTELANGIKEAKLQLQLRGIQSGKVFLAGHGIGGTYAAMYGYNNPSDVSGILLLGSSAIWKINYKLSEYPLPILTLSGDLDGINRITLMVDVFQQLQKQFYSQAEPSNLYKTPVIVQEGINHADFASGKTPAELFRNDLRSNVTSESAYKMISAYIANFITIVLGSPYGNVSLAAMFLREGFINTSRILQPLVDIKNLDQNEAGISNWTIIAQTRVLNLSSTDNVKITNREQEYFPFLLSKPIVETSKEIKITTFANIKQPPSTSSRTTPDEVQSKMMSQIQGHPNSGITCADINRMAFDLAMSTSSSVAKNRYNNWPGKPIKFQPDITEKTGLGWTDNDLKLDYSSYGLSVTSYSLKTGPGILGPYQYCKLLSPYRAMEWIYIDSLMK